MNKTAYRILVIDDDPDIGIMIKMILEYSGYSVLVSDRGDQAEELIRNNHVDLLIMDMLLSGINGTDICRRLKQTDSTTHQLPIMMISAHPNAKETCLEAGADDFIAKPFDMDDILSKISRLVAPKN